MAEAIFDPLSSARRTEQAGFTRQQVKAPAEERARFIDDRLATKADVASVRQDIAGVRQDIEILRFSTAKDIEALRLATDVKIESLRESTRLEIALVRRDIEVLRRDLTIRLGGMVIGEVAVASTIVGWLSRLPNPHP